MSFFAVLFDAGGGWGFQTFDANRRSLVSLSSSRKAILLAISYAWKYWFLFLFKSK